MSTSGIKPDPKKIDRIGKWPPPATGKELAGFLGLCNYYRSLVPAFADTSDALYKAAKTSAVNWTPELSAAFEDLKSKLLDHPVVQLPNPQKDFILETDASRVAVGAVLKQRFEDTQLEHPVAFFSRALTGTERNYSAYELEMYAVVRAAEHFRIYLLGKEFLLRTDHMALKNILQRDLPPTTRVARWILRLSEFNFKIEHKKGQENIIADVLSRLPFATATEAANNTLSLQVSTTPEGGNSQAAQSFSIDRLDETDPNHILGRILQWRVMNGF